MGTTNFELSEFGKECSHFAKYVYVTYTGGQFFDALKVKVFFYEKSQDSYKRNYKKFEPCHNSHVSALKFGRYSKVSSPQRVKKAIDCQGVYTGQRLLTHTQTTLFLPRFMVKR
jgi:hypothetical protein